MLWRYYEEDKKKHEREEKPSHKKRDGNYTPLIVLVAIFAIVLMFPLLRSRSISLSFAPAPAADLDARSTQLAEAQYRLEQDRIRANEQSTAQAYDAQQQIAAQQMALNTQIAQATSTQSVQATSTAIALSQTPMAATQIALNIAIKKQQDDAYWSQYVSPLKVLGWAVFIGMCLLMILLMAYRAFNQLLPAVEARVRTVSEDGRERLLHFPKEGGVVRPDLMYRPKLDENGESSGGADDPATQERIALTSMKVKAMQALPQGTKLPGSPVAPKKETPEIEITTASDVKGLLDDARNSLNTHEEA